MDGVSLFEFPGARVASLISLFRAFEMHSPHDGAVHAKGKDCSINGCPMSHRLDLEIVNARLFDFKAEHRRHKHQKSQI